MHPLQFETEARGTRNEPGLGDISSGLAELDGEGNGFAILRRSPTDYIQAAGNAKRGLTVEYHDPATDGHFTAGDPIALRDAVELFHDFRLNGTKWRSAVEWKPMDLSTATRKGCAGMIAIGAAVVAAAGGGAAMAF